VCYCGERPGVIILLDMPSRNWNRRQWTDFIVGIFTELHAISNSSIVVSWGQMIWFVSLFICLMKWSPLGTTI